MSFIIYSIKNKITKELKIVRWSLTWWGKNLLQSPFFNKYLKNCRNSISLEQFYFEKNLDSWIKENWNSFVVVAIVSILFSNEILRNAEKLLWNNWIEIILCLVAFYFFAFWKKEVSHINIKNHCFDAFFEANIKFVVFLAYEI